MPRWTLNDIPWERFDPDKVDPEILRIVKAASLTEYDGASYADYLCAVFHDDPEFQETARRWGEEEIQHGSSLGRWAQLADPGYDLDAAYARFKAGYSLPPPSAQSIRGSRVGEMIARCIVETGTSSFYTALAEAVEEPVLVAICRKIAADELRHYKLFYECAQKYLPQEGVGLWRRMLIAFGRIAETSDDELAYAYYAANGNTAPYDRARCSREYARRAYAVYRPHHIERGMAMVFKAVGLKPHSRLQGVANRLAWWQLNRRAAA